MSGLLVLIPVAMFLGALGLIAFLWSLRAGQYEDLQGAAHRILEDDDMPLQDSTTPKKQKKKRHD